MDVCSRLEGHLQRTVCRLEAVDITCLLTSGFMALTSGFIVDRASLINRSISQWPQRPVNLRQTSEMALPDQKSIYQTFNVLVHIMTPSAPTISKRRRRGPLPVACVACKKLSKFKEVGEFVQSNGMLFFPITYIHSLNSPQRPDVLMTMEQRDAK